MRRECGRSLWTEPVGNVLLNFVVVCIPSASLEWVSHFIRVFVFCVQFQKVERRRVCLSNNSWSQLGGAVSLFGCKR